MDITNVTALQQELAKVAHLGTITGIIHGAGVLADKLIEKKTEQDFEIVYSTKIKGLHSMLECVNENTLEHLVLFSSAAGFYGNLGQSDYSIANEILNKFAYDFKRKHPSSHVASFNWGPWDGGMVTPQLKEMFAQRNIEVIPIEVGTQMVVDNLKTGEAIQLLVGSPFAPEVVTLKQELQTYRIHRHLTLEANPFIKDHVIGGNAVIPVTCATAWMVNGCEQLFGGYKFFSCENIKVFKGIIFDDTLANNYILDLKEIDRNNGVELSATLWSETAKGKPLYHYSAKILLKLDIPAAPIYDGFDKHVDETLADLSLYENGTLFHGPRFQGIKRVLNISPEKLTIECFSQTIAEKDRGQFQKITIDPIISDAQFQFMLVWVRHYHQAASLPLCCASAEHFQNPLQGETFYVSLDVQSSSNSKLVAKIITHDANGKIYSRVSGAEVTISKQLNNLFIPSTVPEPKTFLPFWRNLLEIGEWPGEALFTALFRRFVGNMVFEDANNFNAIKGKPVLYLANHQVGVESILFGFSLTALSEYPINVVAKEEHKKSWINQLSNLIYSYPGLKHPDLMFYFDRSDQFSMLNLLGKIKTVMKEEGRSLLIHVEGTRSLSCQQPIKNLSAVFIDLAIELDIPIIPIGFTGGLPIEALETRSEFPIGYTQQNYHIGASISPSTLKQIPNAERKALVLERLNQLCEIKTASPQTPEHSFEQAVHLWMKQKGVSEIQAVLYKTLEEISAPAPEIRTMLRGIREGYLQVSDSPESRWLGELGLWLSNGKLEIQYI